MWLLSVDTSTCVTSVCLKDESSGFFEAHAPAVETPRGGLMQRERHQEELSALVRDVFSRAGLRENHLNKQEGLLLCGAGPGSFTGLRIGLSFFKGLSFAWGVPLLMVGSLHAAAEQLYGQHEEVAVCIEAGRGEVLIGICTRGTFGNLQENVLPREKIAAYLEACAMQRRGVCLGVLHDGCLEGLMVPNAVQLRSEKLAYWIITAFTEVAVKMPDWVQGAKRPLDRHSSITQLSVLEPRYTRDFRAVTVAERLAMTARR